MGLKEELIAIGFINVTWSSESASASGRIQQDEGHKLSYNYNNGISIVIDDKGCSWIIANRMFKRRPELKARFEKMFSDYKLSANYGVFVPFSNDGGNYASDHWPEAYPSREQRLVEAICEYLEN